MAFSVQNRQLSSRSGKIMRLFNISSAIILALTGLVKLWSAFGEAKMLGIADPIFGMSFGNLMLAVGAVELVVAVVCLFSKNGKLPPVLVAWLGTSFLFYRIGLWGIGWHRPCSCLGNLTDALYIPTQIADTAMKIILAYLLIGSYAALFWLWRHRNSKLKL